jgi:adenosylcobyric acid synthase
MLGREVSDPEGVAGESGTLPGLGLLPGTTLFYAEKELRNVTAEWQGEQWTGYEIHMGQTRLDPGTPALLRVGAHAAGRDSNTEWRKEGAALGRVWGTYLHGLFESTLIRKTLARSAGASRHTAPVQPWRQRRQAVYGAMADLLEEYLQLDPLWRYVAD